MALSSLLHRIRRRPLSADMVAFVAVICLALCGLEAWHAWQARQTVVLEDKVETANLARSLAQHAHDTIQSVDTSLLSLRERIEIDGLGPGGLGRMHELMVQRVANLPLIHGLFMMDAVGNGVANSLTEAAALQNYSDRPYFKFHKANPSRDMIIGEPVHSKTDGSWIITVSRRLDTPDGSFAGVVEATISIDFLQKFYGTFDIGRDGAIGLMTERGIMVARMPTAGHLIGTDVSNGEVYQHYRRNGPIGSFEYLGGIDEVMRLGSYRKVENYPLVIVVSHGRDEALAGWRADVAVDLTVGLLAIAALLVLGNRIARQIRDRHEAERRYRLLANNSSDAIVCASLDGRRLYVSPAFTAMTGWGPEHALGRHWDTSIYSQDLPLVLDTLAQLRRGTNQATVTFRHLRRDGAPLWVEARIQRIAVEGEGGEQFVANIRDISKRKAAEDEIVDLNRQLVVQARTDALTGLANRRSLDERLRIEWARATRETRPLSLLMIDLDRFKAYNDRYGHLQGDSCLKAVGAVLAGCARRPADVVARYGGEELIFLLPNTDEAGAQLMAEKVRAAVEAMGLPHLANQPVGVATISVGLATLRPTRHDKDATPRDLVALADRALYRAKLAGRNRVGVPVMPGLERELVRLG